jgi:Na+-transporting NADH:ubiquinone oxidoreductase subunit A
LKIPSGSRIATEEFAGPHPAGSAGVHIHFLMPVSRKRTVWHLHYQDVAAIGRLFETGVLDMERVIALAGPSVIQPRLVRTRIGTSTDELVQGQIEDGEQRVISGSVLSGRQAEGEVEGFLGRHHLQVSVLHEGRSRELIGWLLPGPTKFSTINAYVGKLIPGQRFRMTTTTNGSRRAMAPTGMHESVMPMDILPTFLLRALLMQDVERAEELGVLELDEEDLALCTFVDVGKNEYGPLLRQMLATIEKEG